jgi:hypothetical protein
MLARAMSISTTVADLARAQASHVRSGGEPDARLLARLEQLVEIDDELTAEYAAKAVTAVRAAGATTDDAEAFDLADW